MTQRSHITILNLLVNQKKKITVYTAKSFDCECPEKNDEE